MNLEPWAESLQHFADWLHEENRNAAVAWSNRLNSSDPSAVEGAVAEAVAWDFVKSHTDAARIMEKPVVGGVDFEFAIGGRTFYVEVTNILTSAVTNNSKMPDAELFSGYYRLLTKQIRDKVRNKNEQAAKVTDAPVLIAVTTLHSNASRSCVGHHAVEFAMGSTPMISRDFDPRGLLNNRILADPTLR